MSSESEDRLRRLCEALRELTSGQVGWVEAVVQQFRRPAEFRRLPASDVITDCVLQDFGDALRIHHCFSREPFTKDKFEFATEGQKGSYKSRSWRKPTALSMLSGSLKLAS